MKVSELTGAELDYWVSQCNPTGRASASRHKVIRHSKGETCYYVGFDGAKRSIFAPSTKWKHAGPIIEQELIDLDPPEEDERGRPDAWSAIVCAPPRNYQWMYGSTPLIAAMRAYVASKFGGEVPDEVKNS